ncbi:type I restriction-modification system endonuclease [Paenibacillus sp. strain BS8-2]
MAGNFEFLRERWEILSTLGEMAERNLFIDPNTSLIKLRMFGETLTQYLCALEELVETHHLNQIDRLNKLKQEDLVPEEVLDLLHSIRKVGNKANHEIGIYGTTAEAQLLVKMAYRIAGWFMQVYGDWSYQPVDYVEPVQEEKASNDEQLEQLSEVYEAKLALQKKELEELRREQAAVSNEVKKKRHTKSKQAGSAFALTEAETRLIIDEKLRQVGWEADSQTLRYGLGTRPEKGRNLAIAEWALKTGFADYALFCGLELVGIVEAKRISRNVEADIAQSKKYAMRVVRHGDEIIHGPWGNYQVPFLFSTNGRPYLEQLKHMSGIWFLDARKPTNHPRPLQAWYSPQGLKDLLKQDTEQAAKDLQDEKLDYLKLRPYQEDAILSVEGAIDEGQRNILLAMATGTGKTRMAIGLIYRLIKHNRFKRILFLVDRSALGRQAEAAFKDSKLESYHSFTEIFELQTLDDKKPNPETKVQIATVQGMVKRIFYNESDEAEIPSVDQYDCVIVDEAHRGYTLDKEMSELELEFRDHEDYVSKYRKVLDYFDAFRIGLTATPALHTVEIFGRPVFNYSYREAVIDGYLIDHEPPMQFETQLKKHGIKWLVGEEVAVYDISSGNVEKELLQDEINLEVTQFNKTVITENFNRVILEELTKYIDPESEGKTLIFAATDDHADMVVRIFKEELEKAYGVVDDNAVLKITGSIKDPLHAIKLFKNERLPSIVVTVDLLTTGIDIPSITNLVFLRRVRSRILYEQMLGRATRRCDEIGKDHFMIYDAVGIYETLKPYTDMKPVVTKPTVSLDVLTSELAQLEDEEQGKPHKDQIIAKMQRKKRTWTQKDHDDFQALSGGMNIEKFIDDLKSMSVLQASADLQTKKPLIAFIDENRGRGHRIYISDHEDKLISTSRGYGDADKPEDYLEGFHAFITENLNLIPALTIICTRPNDLTRDELRKLRVELDQKGYSEKMLQAAWRDAKNEDIAADIISFIRQQALGDPLISHEERIEGAMKKIYDMKVWSKVQKDWLKRIEKQLLQESVLDPNPEKAFEVEPFKSKGGYKQLNKIFDGEMDTIVTTINTALYTPRKRDYA